MTIGIDYGMGNINIDHKTGIRYGVISQNDVLQAWSDSSEPYYGKPSNYFECPECGVCLTLEESVDWGDSETCDKCWNDIDIELPDCSEPASYCLDADGIRAECGESGDIFVTKSPYFTFCELCSPCAPGAGYLTNPLDPMDPPSTSGNAHNKCGRPLEGNRAYCFGHEWFEDDKAPYRVFSVETGKEILPS